MQDVKTVRDAIPSFKAYSAGLSIGEIKERYGLRNIIKLASNENPLGSSPVVRKVIAEHAGEVFRYPRVNTPGLVRAIARRLDVPESMIVAGNGSDDIIDLVIRIKCRPGRDHILAFDPCYSMYPIQAKLCGVEYRSVPLNEDFSFPLDKLADATNEDTAVVVLVTPDNPSGLALTADEIEAFAARLPSQTLLVVDEAYVDFAEPYEKYSVVPRLHRMPNTCVMRTMAKAYGLAGLRLGYGVMPAWLADYTLRVRLPFSVNILAEYAGRAALEDEVFYNETRRVNSEGREFVTRSLTDMGCGVWPSQANFVMFRPFDRFGGPDADALSLFEKLLQKGIILRSLESYGRPDLIRMTIGTDKENKAVVAALKEITHE
jgi:histidinol-phosphate aminotransferase